jgi:hypothetical protein
MNDLAITPAHRYRKITEALLRCPSAELGSGTKGFGASALKVHGRIFAMLSSKQQFVVKLPKPRVDALVAAGAGERFDPGRGRLMKEWLVVASSADADWLAFAREAFDYVADVG